MYRIENGGRYLTVCALVVLLAVISGIAAATALADTPPLIAISGLILVFSFWLMHRAVRVFNLRALTIPGFCYLNYLGIVLIPSLFVFADHPGQFRNAYLFAVESVTLTMPLGILVAKSTFRFDSHETTTFFNAPLQEDASDPGVEVYILFLACAWTITFLYIREVRTIPLFYMIAHPGDPHLLARMREESMKLLDSPLRYIYMVLDSSVYPLLIILGFARYLNSKRQMWAFLFLASFIPGVLYAGFTIAKGPVAMLFVMLSFYFYLYRHGRVGAKFIVVLVVTSLAFPMFVIRHQYAGDPSSNVFASLQSIGHRMFYLPAEVLYYYFEVFPHVIPYQHGMTIDKLAMLAGEPAFDAANAVGRYIYPTTQYSINANAPFVGNLNADFGMTGVLLGGFLAGLIFEVAQIYVVRRGKSLFNLAIYAILLYKGSLIADTALPIALLSQGPIFVLLLAWAMRSLDSVIVNALKIHRPRVLANRSWHTTTF